MERDGLLANPEIHHLNMAPLANRVNPQPARQAFDGIIEEEEEKGN
jgi:hypothetical protein